MAKPKRRLNGEGSLVLRSDGRWQASLTIDGKRRAWYGKTRKEAQEKLDRARQLLAAGHSTTNDRITVETFLDFWLREVVGPRIRPSTYRSYDGMIRTRIIPGLGTIKLQRLTPQHVVSWQNALTKRGASGTAVRSAKQVLSMALKQAMAWDMVTRNVAALVAPPASETSELEIPTAAEVRTMFASATSTTETVIVALGALLGLRNAEARALRWRDVDLQRGTIDVRNQVARQAQGPPEFTPLKTKASRRTLPLPPQIVRILREHHVDQLNHRMAHASVWHDYDLVLCTDEGYTISGGMLLDRFHVICARAGLLAYKFHALRHACASLLAAEGIPLKTAMEILGHTDPKMTNIIYTHSYSEGRQHAVAVLGALLDEAV